MQKNLKRTLVAGAVGAALALSNMAFADDGFVTGKSVSQSGQILSGVQITVSNNETGLKRSVTSESDGSFKFPLLPPGSYTLEAKKNGFLVVKNDKLQVSGSGKTNVNLTLETGDIERISVTGSTVSSIDVTSSESQLTVDLDFLDKVPVARDTSSIALLAPGTIEGDSDFGDGQLTSMGGSSVGENVFYVNGINVTNFRNGLGGSELPFEMYESFDIKTGGYSAEFGRSTGGVINARTKSGSNEFKWGASAYFEPDALRSKQPDVKRTDAAAIEEAGTPYYLVNYKDNTSETNVNVWASGALIQDKLFFFGLVNQKIRDADYGTSARFYDRKGNDTLFAAKLDWYITDDHILEFTGWDNGSDLDVTKSEFNPDSDTVGNSLGDYIQKRGGSTYGLKYTGIISDEVTVSAQYSVNKASYSNLNVGANPLGDKPMVYERFTDKEFGAFGLRGPTMQDDKRTAYRFDVDWYVTDDHTLRFGIDYEDMKASEATERAGGVAYRYQGCNTDALANNELAGCDKVRVEYYVNHGDFQTKSNAFYVEDTWTITDNLTARIGLRNETFENYNKSGEKFVDVSNQWAPRVGLSWDIKGDGDSKLFANYGKYYLPVATNTNIRLAGDELYTRQLYYVESIGADFVPVLGDKIGGQTTYADGTQKSTGESVNADLNPMYQSEYILGYEQVLNDSWNMGVKATYRNLDSSLEDIAIDKGFNDFIEANFPGQSCTNCSGFHYYVLTNPGGDTTITTDPDGDGPLELATYTIPADVMGYPKAERQYLAVDFTLNRVWDEKWMMNFTYTWAHSWGNNEGFVRSDNDQDDAGLTTNFDQPGLTDGANGNLPNDRRHVFKLSGAYQLMEDVTLGANFRWAQGRPRSSFGFHPTDVFASYYQAASFVKDGEIVDRGTLGRTPSTWTLDLSARYDVNFNGTPVTFRADVFNVFDNHKATQLNEVNERFAGYGDQDQYVGEHEPDFGLATSFQTPRNVRLSVNVEF